jgi:hypothetical protein
MKQINQIGKYTKKESVLLAKKGKTFVTPQNRTYVFDYEKIGNKYMFILCYNGYRMQVKEADFNRSNIDDLLAIMHNTIVE